MDVGSESAWYRRAGETAVLRVRVQARAKFDRALAIHDGRVRIATRAAPVERKANRAILEFIAREFGVRTKDVAIVRGETHRDKEIVIERPRLEPAWLRPAAPAGAVADADVSP